MFILVFDEFKCKYERLMVSAALAGHSLRTLLLMAMPCEQVATILLREDRAGPTA